MTRIYDNCGLRVRSELELHLPESSGTEWDIDIVWGDELDGTDVPPEGNIVASLGQGDDWWYVGTETPDGYALRFARCGEFEISADLRSVRVRPDPAGEHRHVLPVLAAGTALAFVLTLRGATLLHASAVAVDGRAMAFVGQSGRGKSTMAALMCVAGAALVTDDVLAVRADPDPMCVGGATELRLREKAAPIADAQGEFGARTTVDERTAFSPTNVVRSPVPLSAVVIPSPNPDATEVAIVRVPPKAALFAFLAFPRVYGWRRDDELTRDFAALSRLVVAVPTYAASIPWGPPFDPAVTEPLLELLDTDEPRSTGTV